MRPDPRAVHPDRWRTCRDWALLTACFYNVLKIVHVWLGLTFGMAKDYSDPMFMISLAITVMFGYAFLEDIFRKRYFLGWDGDQ